MSPVPCDHETGDTAVCGLSLDVLWWWAGVLGTNAPGCGGRLTLVGWTGERQGPRVKAIGSKTAAGQTGRTLHSATKTIAEESGSL